MTGMEGRLPEELIDLVFIAFAEELPLKRLLRLRLVSKTYDARIMCTHIFARATFDYQIPYCRDRSTVLKWLRWTYRHAGSSRTTIEVFRSITRKYLRFHDRHQKQHHPHHRHHETTSVLDETEVADTLLQLFADQLISVRTQHMHLPRNDRNYRHLNRPLLWWMPSRRTNEWLAQKQFVQCVCACIACALGNLTLALSLLSLYKSQTDTRNRVQNFVGSPMQAAVRFGQTYIVRHLLLMQTTVWAEFANWSVLDDAVRAQQSHILDMLLKSSGLVWKRPETILSGKAFFNPGRRIEELSITDCEQHRREAITLALRSAAMVRNTDAINMLLIALGPFQIPQFVAEDLLFAACFGTGDSGYGMAAFLFTLFTGLSPNFLRCTYTQLLVGDDRFWVMRTPLSMAVQAGDIQLAQLLLKHGASVDHETSQCWRGVLYSALSKGCMRCMEHVFTPTELAVRLGTAKMVEGAVKSGDPRMVHMCLGRLCFDSTYSETDDERYPPPRTRHDGTRVDLSNQELAMWEAYEDGTHSVTALLQMHGFDDGKSCRSKDILSRRDKRTPLETETAYVHSPFYDLGISPRGHDNDMLYMLF